MFVYRILSIDGGGIRGIVPIRLMQRLCAVSGLEDWLAQCDLIAGTSTGGILALGIAAGLSLEELATLYTEKGGRILDDSLWDDVRDLGKTVGAEYSNRELRKQLQQAFGERPLSQLGKRVMVTALTWTTKSVIPRPEAGSQRYSITSPGPIPTATVSLATWLSTPAPRRPTFRRRTATSTVGCSPTIPACARWRRRWTVDVHALLLWKTSDFSLWERACRRATSVGRISTGDWRSGHRLSFAS